MPFNTFSGGGATSNIDTTYERLGFGASGTGTVVTSGGSVNTYGSWVSLGTTTSELINPKIFISQQPGSGNRYLVDIGLGVSPSSALIEGIASAPGTAGSGPAVADFTGLVIPAGTVVSVRTQGSAASATLYVAVLAEVKTASHPPGFSNCDLITAKKTSNTTGCASDMTFATTAGTQWMNYGTTAKQYGALLYTCGLSQSATLPTNAQQFTLRLATGTTGNEVLISSAICGCVISNPSFSKNPVTSVRKVIPNGTQINLECLAGLSGANDKSAPQVWGLY